MEMNFDGMFRYMDNLITVNNEVSLVLLGVMNALESHFCFTFPANEQFYNHGHALKIIGQFVKEQEVAIKNHVYNQLARLAVHYNCIKMCTTQYMDMGVEIVAMLQPYIDRLVEEDFTPDYLKPKTGEQDLAEESEASDKQ